jgi:hypothetical protein
MWQRSTVTLSMRELDRLKCIQAVIDGTLRATVAAERLGMSPRQVGVRAHASHGWSMTWGAWQMRNPGDYTTHARSRAAQDDPSGRRSRTEARPGGSMAGHDREYIERYGKPLASTATKRASSGPTIAQAGILGHREGLRR